MMKRFMKAPGARCSVLLLLLLALLVTCAPAWAAEYTVTKDGPGADDNITYKQDGGSDQTSTLTTLVNYLVNDGDTVKFVDTEAKTYIVTATLNLDKKLKLIGAGADRTTLQDDGLMSGVLIDCNATGATTANTELSGLTVKGANGGLKITNGSPLVKDCTFSDSTAKSAMEIAAGSPEVTGCNFTANTKGAINVASGGTATVSDCAFSGNSGTFGAGMCITDGDDTTVTNCTFSANTAPVNGGGMCIANGKSKVVNCTFSENIGTSGNGGGLYVAAGSPTVVNTILWNNTANTASSDIYVGSALTLTNCVYEVGSGAAITDTSCFKTDPKLQLSTNPVHYKLGTGSSAIGKGLDQAGAAAAGLTGVTVPTTDQLGNTRKATPDIGAVEASASTGPTGPTTTSEDQSGATVTPVSGGTVSGDQLLVNIPAGGSADVTFNLKDWKDRNGNPVTPNEVRALVGGVERPMTLLTAETYVLTLTPADVGKTVELQGRIAGGPWIPAQKFTVKQSDAATTKPDPTPTPTPKPDPTPKPTPTYSEPITPSDPTPDSGGSSGGGGCQAMGLGLFGFAALALLKRK